MSDRIVVTSQAEMDKVPAMFEGIVELRSKPGVWIKVPSGLSVRACNYSQVEAYGHSQVWAYDFSQVRAYDFSQVRAYDSSRVVAYDSSQVEAYGSSQVVAYYSSQVDAYDSSQVVAYSSSQVRACNYSQVVAYGSSQVQAYDFSQVEAYNSSQVVAYGSSQVEAYDFSQVEAYDSSQVVAYGSSQVEAYDFSQVEGCGNTQILRLSDHANLSVTGNARIVEMPKTPQEYADYYGIEVRDGVAIMYKAVDNNLRAFYNQKVQYKVGETITSECNPSREAMCSTGLHVAYKDWAIRFGMSRASDFRLLEVAVPLDKIVVPRNTDGKVRTLELTVLREVPREEWGFYSTWRM